MARGCFLTQVKVAVIPEHLLNAKRRHCRIVTRELPSRPREGNQGMTNADRPAPFLLAMIDAGGPSLRH